jgi:hypothetical protein
VLIYVLLADRAVEIVADRGIDRHVGAEGWRAIVDEIGRPLPRGPLRGRRARRRASGLGHLERHFPEQGEGRQPARGPPNPYVIRCLKHAARIVISASVGEAEHGTNRPEGDEPARGARALGQPRRLTELARQLGLTKPNVYRLLSTLSCWAT